MMKGKNVRVKIVKKLQKSMWDVRFKENFIQNLNKELVFEISKICVTRAHKMGQNFHKITKTYVGIKLK